MRRIDRLTGKYAPTFKLKAAGYLLGVVWALLLVLFAPESWLKPR